MVAASINIPGPEDNAQDGGELHKTPPRVSRVR